jgi:hypothetical protein
MRNIDYLHMELNGKHPSLTKLYPGSKTKRSKGIIDIAWCSPNRHDGHHGRQCRAYDEYLRP